jgi:imidazolonepropionase-like amidohydrolase
MGTDAGTPFNFHGENAQELERMVALGMTAMNAIRSATGEAAELLGLQNSIGTIQPGRQADLLLVDGNPIKRIGMLCESDRIVGVMKAGRFVAGPLARA